MDNKKDQSGKPTFITKIGFKPAESKIHAFLRLLLCLLLIAAIGLLVYQDVKKPERFFTMNDISDTIKPNSVAYQALIELDDHTRSKYIKKIKEASDNETRIINRYTKSIAVALISAILSEYIINGNANKPLSVIAKTMIFTTINITVS